MEHLSEIIFAVVFLLFSVFAFVRRTVEGRDVEKRNQESEWTADDLPEETRRMLFGDKAPPAAKPARPAQQRRSLDPFDEVRDVFNEMRRQIEVQTAKPRQGAPRPQPPPTLPPQAPRAPRPVHPQQPQFRPQQQAPRPIAQPRPVAPPRQAPRPQPPRMVPQQAEGAMPRQMQVPQQRPAPMPRRQQPRPAQRFMDPDEGPTTPFPRAKREESRVLPARRRGRWLTSPDDLRRGIILSEILGPPRAMREFEV